MKGTALIIRADPPSSETLPLDPVPRPVESRLIAMVHKWVDGYVEVVPGFNTIETDDGVVPCMAFCNEDGKRPELDPKLNIAAMRLWQRALPRPGLLTPTGGLADYLVGTIVVLYGDAEFMAELTRNDSDSDEL